MLLLRAGALGDVLLLRPTVAALKRGGARVVLMAPEPSGAVLVGPGASEVERLIPWDRPDLGALMVTATPTGTIPGSVRRELEAFDLAIAYTRNASLARNLERLVPSVLQWDPTPPPGGFHAARCFAEPLARLGAGPEMDPPACVATASEQAIAAPLRSELPAGFVAVHPGSGAPAKNWPAASFAELTRRLSGDRPFLLVEGPADAAAAGVLRASSRAVTVRDVPLRALGALLSGCSAFVGNDSGVSHLAAAFDAPVVALFGPTDPAIWRPLGRRVRALRSPTGRMDGLAVVDVEAACYGLTSAGAGPPGC